MNKYFIAVIVCMSIVLSVSAQTEFMDQGGKTALEKGSFQINLGSGYTTWGVPIYAGMEYASMPTLL